MLGLWMFLLVQSQPGDVDEPRRGVNRLLGLPCAHLDQDCLRRSFQQWYADPGYFWLNMRDRWVIVPPLFGMRFGEGAAVVRPRDRDAVSAAVDSLMARARTIWDDDSIAVAERRLHLFQLWDDCAEDTPAGREARHGIERFIRELAPRGSPRAYPEAQLRELNRRRGSKTRFAPYD